MDHSELNPGRLPNPQRGIAFECLSLVGVALVSGFDSSHSGHGAHRQKVCGCPPCYRQLALRRSGDSGLEDVHGFPSERFLPACGFVPASFCAFVMAARAQVLHAIITTTSHLKAGSVEQLKLQQWSAAFLLRLVFREDFGSWIEQDFAF